MKTETRTADSRSNRRPQQPNQPPPGAQQKPVAYIGVLTREVPPELRSQLSLPEGFGLLVEEVMPDSPAQHAGLKVYDLLVKFEDQQLVSMEQLMLLVRVKKKGDVVNLTEAWCQSSRKPGSGPVFFKSCGWGGWDLAAARCVT